MSDVTDEEVTAEMPKDKEAVKALVREKLALDRVEDKQAAMYVDVLSDLHTAESMAVIGQK